MLACDELTAPIRCLKSHFRAASVRKANDFVRFHGHCRVAVASRFFFFVFFFLTLKNKLVPGKAFICQEVLDLNIVGTYISTPARARTYGRPDQTAEALTSELWRLGLHLPGRRTIYLSTIFRTVFQAS